MEALAIIGAETILNIYDKVETKPFSIDILSICNRLWLPIRRPTATAIRKKKTIGVFVVCVAMTTLRFTIAQYRSPLRQMSQIQFEPVKMTKKQQKKIRIEVNPNTLSKKLRYQVNYLYANHSKWAPSRFSYWISWRLQHSKVTMTLFFHRNRNLLPRTNAYLLFFSIHSTLTH